MFYIREPEELLTWFLAFDTRRPPTWWLRAVIRGRFTHVMAFANSAATRTWIFIDPNMHATRVIVAPDGDASNRLLAQVSDGAAILKMRVRPGVKFRLRPMFCCTSAIRHILNLPGGQGLGALSVDKLWADCLAHGAEIVANGECPKFPSA